MKNFVRSNMPAAMSTDELNTTWSMNYYTEIPAELWTKFNNIGYSKSGCVLRMFQEVMTEATFAKGLKNYFEDNKFTAVTPDALHAALQKAYNQDFPGNPINIATLMSTWENQAGYPLVSVRLNGNNVEFSQKRHPFTNGEIYSIPLTYSTKTSNNFDAKTAKQWLTGTSLSVASSSISFTSGDWIVLNNQQVGYYRVDYSTELWHAIIDQLKSDHSKIHAINRAVLRDEIYLGWKSFAKVTAVDILESLRYFTKEDEAISWSKSNQFFSELKVRLAGSEVYDHYMRFLRDLTNPQLTTIGYEGNTLEHTDLADLRGQLKSWNCAAKEQNCIQIEHTKWLNYHNTGNYSPLDFCAALSTIDSVLFNELLLGVTTNANYPARGNYLSSLACNENEQNLRSLLDASIDKDAKIIFTATERLNIIRSVISRSYLGVKTTMKFIDEKHAEISALDTTQFVGLFNQLAQYVNPDSVTVFNTLRDKLSTAGYLAAGDLSSVNSIYNTNKAWYDTNYETIKTWFINEPTNQPTEPVS